MAKLTNVSVVLLGVVAGTTALATVMATGCSSSTTAETPDSGLDGTTGSGDGSQSPDGTTPGQDATSDGKSATDAPVADSPADAPDLGLDAGICTTTIGKLDGITDAGDAGDAGDAADAADADGGEAAATGPVLLFGFDGVTGVPTGWSLNSFEDTDAGYAPVLGSTSTDGNTCPGALEVTTPFPAYGEGVQAQYPYGNYTTGVGAVNWTGRSSLHASVKVVAPAAAFANGLNGVQLFVQSGGAFYPNYRGNFESISTFANGEFHAITLSLAPDDAGVLDGGNNAYDPALVEQIGIQIVNLGSQPDGGVAATFPLSTVLIIDDIWLE
jgi:hypothetical protein